MKINSDIVEKYYKKTVPEGMSLQEYKVKFPYIHLLEHDSQEEERGEG